MPRCGAAGRRPERVPGLGGEAGGQTGQPPEPDHQPPGQEGDGLSHMELQQSQ